MAPVKPPKKTLKQVTPEDFKSLLTREGEPPKLSRDQIFEWIDLLDAINKGDDRTDLINAVKRMVKVRKMPAAADATQTGAGTQDPETEFQHWYAKMSTNLKLDPNADDPRHFYDWRKAWLAQAKPDENGHWPSEFKLIGHPNLIVDGIDTRTGKRATWKTMRESQNARQQVELGTHIQNFLSTILGGR